MFLGLLLAFPNQAVLAQDGEEADTLFTISVQSKTSEHPFFEEGFSEGYVVDTTQGKELTLTQGQTYYFVMDEVPSFHPFYISTDLEGSGEGEYTEGVSSTSEDHEFAAAGTDTLIFTPNENAPDTLYYNCTNHEKMGYRLVIQDETATAIDEVADGAQLPQTFSLYGNYPNPFNPTTVVHFDLPMAANVRIDIYSPLGELIKRVRGGQMSAGTDQTVRIDASGLSSGLYLYRVIATAGQEQYLGTGKMMLLK